MDFNPLSAMKYRPSRSILFPRDNCISYVNFHKFIYIPDVIHYTALGSSTISLWVKEQYSQRTEVFFSFMVRWQRIVKYASSRLRNYLCLGTVVRGREGKYIALNNKYSHVQGINTN